LILIPTLAPNISPVAANAEGQQCSADMTQGAEGEHC
jgi:hypothetical protein